MAKKEIAENVFFIVSGWKLKIARNRGGTLCVDVENGAGTLSDRSVRYPHSGGVAYDFPERIPRRVKNKVEELYDRMLQAGILSDAPSPHELRDQAVRELRDRGASLDEILECRFAGLSDDEVRARIRAAPDFSSDDEEAELDRRERATATAAV